LRLPGPPNRQCGASGDAACCAAEQGRRGSLNRVIVAEAIPSYAVSAMRVALSMTGLFVVASVVVFWLWSPFLGAIMMIGAMMGLLVAVGPTVLEQIARWLTLGFRR
jgi:hypothetical protein